MRQTTLTSPWMYFALALGLSWIFTIPLALAGVNLQSSPVTMISYALAGLGPAAAAILLTYMTQGDEGRKAYWRRILDVRRIPLGWYAVIFLTVPALTLLAAGVDRLLGGPGMRLEAAARFLDQPLSLLPFTLFILLFGPLPEEMGWRGYALERLQARWSALNASLILGAVWAIWHLPLFFIPGTYQHGLGFGTPPSWWSFAFNIVIQTIIFTWIFNNTRHSTLSAILFHFMTNYIGELFQLSARAEWVLSALWVLVVLVVLRIWGSQTLTRPASQWSSV